LLAARLETKSKKEIADHKVIFLTMTNAMYSLFLLVVPVWKGGVKGSCGWVRPILIED
jgi:hypothetical protein